MSDEHGETMVKRFSEKEGTMVLNSYNPSCPPVELNEKFRVLGKVIDAWRNLGIKGEKP